MSDSSHKPITSFRDLEVYKTSYEAMLIVMREIIPLLPAREKYDLVDQISRASKAVPRLIAEGYAKRHQKMGFQKYIDDAMAECNEMVVSLEQCRDIYEVEKQLIEKVVDMYDKYGRQLYKLGLAWTSFKTRTS